jgi:hypothetical protein
MPSKAKGKIPRKNQTLNPKIRNLDIFHLIFGFLLDFVIFVVFVIFEMHTWLNQKNHSYPRRSSCTCESQ